MKNIIKNKKGQLDLISIMIVFSCLVVASGVLWYSFSSINEEIKTDPDIAANNFSLTSINSAEKSFQILNWGPVALFVAMFLSLLVSYYKVGSEPYWFVIHFLVLIVVVIAAGMLSNYYYELSIDADLGATFTAKMKLPTLIMFNLPMILGIMGFVSIVVLVTKYVSDKKNYGGGLPGL